MTEDEYKDLLIRLHKDEGSVPYAYQDSLGFWTIGVGRLIDKRKGGGLSQDEIKYLLDNDVKRCVDELQQALPWATNLDSVRFRVLVMMIFQLGIDGFLKFKNTIAKIKNADYIGASQSMLKSLWAQQTPARARRLAIMMRTGEWQ